MSATAAPVRHPVRLVPAPILLVIFGMIALLVFALSLALGVRGQDITILGLALVTAFVGTIPLVLDWSRPIEKRQLLISLMTLSYSAFLVMPIFTRYFLQESTGDPWFNIQTVGVPHVIEAQIVTLVGLVALFVGFYLPVGPFVCAFLPKPSKEWPVHACLGVAAFMIPLGFSIYLAGQFGLVPKRAGTGVLGALAIWTFFGIALLTLTYLRHRTRVALLPLLVVVPLTVAFNFFTGSKRLILLPFFMIAASYLVVERRIRTAWIIAGVASLVILYPVAQFYRDVVQSGNRLGAAQILKDPGAAFALISAFVSTLDVGEYLETGLMQAGKRIDGISAAAVIIRDTPEKVPYQGGWSIGYIFLSYIPRVVWPGKPDLVVGQWVTTNYGPGPHIRSHTGPSWVGELFFNFGHLGVVPGMLILGIFFRILQELFFYAGAPIPALLAAVATLSAVLISPGGRLMSPINGVIFNVAPIFLLHLVVRTFSGSPRRGIGAPSPTGLPPPS